MYYTAQIVLFGAEFTHVRSRQRERQRREGRTKLGGLVRVCTGGQPLGVKQAIADGKRQIAGVGRLQHRALASL
jgi:hypothetical protein